MASRRASKATSPRKLIGYARVSTEEQITDAQVSELKACGCEVIYSEHGSGASRARPILTKLLKEIEEGDVLVVVRLDRLARSVSHLLAVIEELEERGAYFRSLQDPIDTATPQGMFSLQVLGAVAQLERALIAERTKAGMRAARERGKLPGNPRLRTKEPGALRALEAARRKAYLDSLIASADNWLPLVRRMRPFRGWQEIVEVLKMRGQSWTAERLRRAVGRLVAERLAEKELMGRSHRRASPHRLETLVAGIALANPNLSLRNIASQLERMGERTPRGGRRWSASSVKNLLDKLQWSGTVPNELPRVPDPKMTVIS